MNMFKAIGYCFVLLLIFSTTLRGQIITTVPARGSAPDFNICVPDGTSSIKLKVDTTVTGYSGHHIRHYLWIVDNNTLSDTNIVSLSLNSNSSHVYRASLQLSNGSGSQVGNTQSNFTFQVHHTPPTPVELDSNSQVIYQGKNTYNLKSAFTSVLNTAKYNYLFTNGSSMVSY